MRCKNIDEFCFVHLVRRRYGSFIAFVVHNEQEKKTFTCISYDVQKNTVSNKISHYDFTHTYSYIYTYRMYIYLKFRLSIKNQKRDQIGMHKERCARIEFGVIKFLIFSLFLRHLGSDRATSVAPPKL